METFLLAGKLGVDLQFVPDLLSRSGARSPILSHVATRLLERNFEGDQIPLRVALKDTALACALAEQSGTPLHVGTETLNTFQETVDRGMGDDDLSSVFLLLEEMAEGTGRIGE